MGWGGWAALMVMKGFSQMRGNRGDVSELIRSDVLGWREEIEEFVGDLFNHRDFRLPGEVPWLGIRFSKNLLYTTEELTALARTLSSTGLGSFQTVREDYLGLDDLAESKLMQDSHERREDFTPPFEPKQGLLNPDPEGAPEGGVGEAGRPPKGEENPE